MKFKKALYHVGEGMDSNAVIGVVGAGWHPGESFSIDVCPKDGTARSECILFVCTTLNEIYTIKDPYTCASM